MDKQECTKAIKKARRVFVYAEVLAGKGIRGFRISKTKALLVIRSLPDDAEFKVGWLDDEQRFLSIG